MKKYLLLILILSLSGCVSNALPYCEQYIHKTDGKTTKLFLKEGRVQKETTSQNASFSEQGLFTYQNQTLNLFIKDKKEVYHLKEDELLHTQMPNYSFKCN